MNRTISLASGAAPAARAVNWPRVGLFVGLAFALTWLLNLGMFLAGGLSAPVTGIALVTQMLLPAFAALLLETFVFADSPLYYKVYRGPARWFTYFYMASTLLMIAGTLAVMVSPGLAELVGTVQTVLVIVGALVVVGVRWRGGRDAYAGAGMPGGKIRWWLALGLAVAAYYGLSALLNAAFVLGTPVKPADLMPPETAAAAPLLPFYGLMLLNTIILGPLLNIMPFFGEEYGWRGFLQRALENLGRVKATLLIGVIWGLWHAPLILMGYNFPENPVLGVLLMTVFCVEAAYVFAYGVYKSQGVWTAAILHGVNNNAVAFFFAMVINPTSNIVAFGVGVYGLALLAVIVLLLLRDPIWKQRGYPGAAGPAAAEH